MGRNVAAHPEAFKGAAPYAAVAVGVMVVAPIAVEVVGAVLANPVAAANLVNTVAEAAAGDALGGASLAGGAVGAGKAAKALEPSLKTMAKVEKQLVNHGVKSVLKSQQKLERRLSEHTGKLQQIKSAGGHTSSVEREIRGFKKELEAIRRVTEQDQ